MKFKYKTTNLLNDKLPILDIIITNPKNNTKIEYYALLDTGAFMSVFHTDVAKLLDIDLDKIKREIKFGGVAGNNLRGKPYILNIMVAQRGKSHSFDACILFSDNINPNGEPLLGRQGFIDQFKRVEFCLGKDKFYLHN